MARLSKLHVPISKALFLAGIEVTDESGDTRILRSEEEKSQALANEWQPTFNPKTIPMQEAEAYLANSSLGTFEGVADPNPIDFLKIIKRAKNRTPGPNNIPDEAWLATKHTSIPILGAYCQHLMRGNQPHEGFNWSGIGFPPKGERSLDAVEVIRRAKATRPISLKNTDNKIIVGVAVSKLTPAAKINTHHTQNGFVGGRNFLKNVLDLDSVARIMSMLFGFRGHSAHTETSSIPIMPLFDFEAAFPSVAHEWLWLVLKYRKIPISFQRLFWSIYKGAVAIAKNQGYIYIYS